MAPNLPRHVVVDGSNIATEGRSHPSLKQLDEAVRAFMAEHSDHTVTVVVDATFGHRIDKSEVAAFDSAIDENELVCPPAGAIGRGDAFVLQIADKADAMILSNDSFQEFHGEYKWLFDEGRLMGGKPVPHVGWVFVLRSPVRGATSRRALRGVKKSGPAASKKRAGRPSAAASAPLPVPKSPPPRRKTEPTAAAAPAKPSASVDQKRKSADALNPLLAFVEFVAHHPVGSPVDAEVESFSSHGAYVIADGVRCYVPLRFLGKPAPRSAREVVALGEKRSFTVVSIAAGRRGVDLALPGFEPEGVTVTEAPPAKRKAATKKAKATAKPEKATEKTPAAPKADTKADTKKAAAKKAPAKKVAAKKAAAPKETALSKVESSKVESSKVESSEASPKEAASKAETKKAVAKKAPRKSVAKKSAATKKSAASA